jgi:Ig-like domain CHU_C associated
MMPRLLAVTALLFLTVNAFAFQGRPVSDLRFDAAGLLTSQEGIALTAGDDEYLAAWFETLDDEVTIRATRLDAAGNYLSGEGIVLGTATRAAAQGANLSIAWNGSAWLVLWTTAGNIFGRVVSRAGFPRAEVEIGGGFHAVVSSGRSGYLVLYDSGGDIYSVDVSAAGVVGPKKTVARRENLRTGVNFGVLFLTYDKPLVVPLGAEILTVFQQRAALCTLFPLNCDYPVQLSIAGNAVRDSGVQSPFGISPAARLVGAASSGARALVTTSGAGPSEGVFLRAAAPRQPSAPFRLDGPLDHAALASDGRDFAAAWLEGGNLIIASIADGGTINDRREQPFDHGDWATAPAIAASSTLAALAGFTGRHRAYAHIARGMVASSADFEATALPRVPSGICATDAGDGKLAVRWEGAPNILGYFIDLVLSDGTDRVIGVAPGRASQATISKGHWNGAAVRVRSWNAAGASVPSAVVPSQPAPQASLPTFTNACAGMPVEITATLSGLPPFLVRWSDGEQSQVNGFTVTRSLTLQTDVTLSIASFSDASCEQPSSGPFTLVRVTPAPVIESQTRTVLVVRNQTPILQVTTQTKRARFAWYAGTPGDTSRPVGTDNATFTTPPATQTMRYWVRVATDCATVDSDAMTVVPNPRRRAVR